MRKIWRQESAFGMLVNSAFGKGRTLPPRKCATFLGHEFLCEWNQQAYSKFYMNEGVFPFYRMRPRALKFFGLIAVFGGLSSQSPFWDFVWRSRKHTT
jgi:hypothetical protein